METNLEGKITEKEFLREVDLGHETLGPCWIKRSGSTNDNKFQTEIDTGQRQIFIPSEKEELNKYLIDLIENAGDIICVSSFLIQSSDLTNALLSAADRGVKVFLLTAREDDLKKVSEELTEFEKRENIIDNHKALLDSFAGKILVRTSHDFHAKYFLVDPNSQSPFGLVMTCNATIDAMRGRNIEVALTLLADEIESYFSHFITGFWKMANHELLEKSKLDAVNKEVNLTIDYGEIKLPSTCIDTNSLREKIFDLVNSASQSLILTAWSFDENYITKAISDAIDRNIQVYIYTKPNGRNTKALLALAAKGAIVLGYDRFHAKTIIVDGKHGLLTTANFTKLGLESGFEVSVLLEKHDIDYLKPVLLEWDSQCDWKLEHDPLLADVDEEYKYYNEKNDNWFTIKVASEIKKELPTITVRSCEEMLNQNELNKYIEKISNSNSSLEKAKMIKVKQKFKPAIIPKNVSEEKRDDCPFPVYHGKKKSKKYILVQTWEDLRKAQEYAKKLTASIVISGE